MLKDLKEQIKILEPHELEEIINQCEYLLTRKTVDKGNPSDFAYSFYDELQRRSKNAGVIKFPSIDYLERNKGKLYNIYITEIEIIEEWLKESFGKKLYTEQTFMCDFLAKLYLKTIKKWYDTLDYGKIIFNINKLPSIFEGEFPEYILNNLQNLIFKNKNE